MTIGIMQPYLFPYLGYFQNIAAVDQFVLYNDVNFIRQGWINRNRILVDNREFLFTVPLEEISSFKLICDSKVNQALYPTWKLKFLRTLQMSYSKAPNFEEVFPIVESVLEDDGQTIDKLAGKSISSVCEYLSIGTTLVDSKNRFGNEQLSAEARVIDICQKLDARKYVNAIGGQELYSKKEFSAKGIDLNFIKMRPVEYEQFSKQFIPGLSIIDVLMFNDVNTVQGMLRQYDLL